MQQWHILLRRAGTKQAARNLAWLIVERGVRFVLGLVVGIFVVRHLGPDRLGALSYCMAIISLVGCFSALGLDAPVKRDILRDPGDAGSLLANAALVRLAAGLIAYLGVVAAAASGFGVSGDERRLLAISGLLLFQPAVWVSELWLQAQLRARVIVIVQLSALAVSSLLRIALIKFNASVLAFAWAIVLEVGLGAVGMAWAARKDGLRLPWREIGMTKIYKLLLECWPLLFTSLAIIIYMKIDEVMLRHLVGAPAVGSYAAAARLSEVWYFIPTALGASVLPALIRARATDAESYKQRMQQYYDLSAALAYGLAVPIAFLAPWLVNIAFGEQFSDAGPILAVHIWSSIFVFLGIARGQWLINESLARFYLCATVGGAVVNIVLNVVFIPQWQGLGAAWATLISYALSAWTVSYLHPVVRDTAVMQTRALLIPFRVWRYFIRR